MKSIKYLIYIFNFIFTILSLSFHSNLEAEQIEYKNEKKLIDLEKNIINDIKKFKKLPSENELHSRSKIGNINPFNIWQKDVDNQFSNLKLMGIITTNNESYAIVEFEKTSGGIFVGDIGGETTNLLPNGVQFVGVAKEAPEIIIKFKDKLNQLGIR